MLGCNFGITTLAGRRRNGFKPNQLPGLVAWYDPSDLSTMFQDAAKTIPVAAAGDPVGVILDKSGNGYHAVRNTLSGRPIYQTDGNRHWLQFDGVDDVLNAGIVTTSGSSVMVAAIVAYTGTPTAMSGGVFSNAIWKNGGVQLGYNGSYHYFVSNTLTEEQGYYASVPLSSAGVVASFTGQGAFVYHSAMGEVSRTANRYAQPSTSLLIGMGTQGGRTGYFPGKFYGGVYAQTDSAGAHKLLAWCEKKRAS